MDWISTIIENTIEILDQDTRASLVNHVKSGASGIPHDVDRILLSEGRKHFGKFLTETEKKDLRSSLADMVKHARIENIGDDAFEFQAGNYTLKSSGSGNTITAVIVGGCLVLAGIVGTILVKNRLDDS